MRYPKLSLLFFGLLLACIFISSSQAELTVTLNSPEDNATLTSYFCNFTYTPIIGENESFTDAYLYLNGSLAASNITSIVNGSINNFQYVFASNGTYLWNIQVDTVNDTASSATNSTVNIAVPDPTIIPNGSSSGSDFILLSIFLCAFSFALLVLGIKENMFPQNAIFLTLSAGVSFVTCLVMLSLNSPYSVVFSQVFFFFGMVSLILLIIVGVRVLNARHSSIYGNIYKR